MYWYRTAKIHVCQTLNAWYFCALFWRASAFPTDAVRVLLYCEHLGSGA